MTGISEVPLSGPTSSARRFTTASLAPTLHLNLHRRHICPIRNTPCPLRPAAAINPRPEPPSERPSFAPSNTQRPRADSSRGGHPASERSPPFSQTALQPSNSARGTSLGPGAAGSRSPALMPAPPPPPPPTPTPTVLTTFPAHLRHEVLSNGVLLVDKPVGWEVTEVVAAVQRATRAGKVACVTPLDAGASGLVVLCFGEATRLAARVERAVKRYEGSLVLGSRADSWDVRGGSFVGSDMPWGHIAGDEELQEAADALMCTAAAAAGTSPGTASPTTRGPGNCAGNDLDTDHDTDAIVEGKDEAEEQVEEGVAVSGAPRVVQVLPLRYRLRQLPGSTTFVEEDAGASTCTSSLQVRSFRVWESPQDATDNAAGAAAVGATAPPTAAAGEAAAVEEGWPTASSTILAGQRPPFSRIAGYVDRSRGRRPQSRLQLSQAITPAGLPPPPAPRGRAVRFMVELAGRIHVRSLIAMYGRRLRTMACLCELRRTAVGGLDVEDAWALEALLPILQRYRP